MNEMMPHYNQRNHPWADIPYHGHTVRTDGCGPVAFAMAASYLLGREVEPSEIVKWTGRSFAGFAGRGTRGVFFVRAAEAYGLACTRTNNTDEAVEAVKSGFPVIYYTEKSQGVFSLVPHYLVLSGMTDEGEMYIHNPNGMHDGESFSPEIIDRYRVRSIRQKSFYILKK